jgi:serine/threonine-protein kinase HipA
LPIDVKPPVLSTAIDLDDPSASLELALSVADYFELAEDKACELAGDVALAVSGRRTEATRQGFTKAECNRRASAFRHDDLTAALSL